MNYYNDEPLFHPAPRYTVGLDLGQTKDYTALVILERHGCLLYTSDAADE